MKKIIALAVLLMAFSGSINAITPNTKHAMKEQLEFDNKREIEQLEGEFLSKVDSLAREYSDKHKDFGRLCDKNLPNPHDLPKNAKILAIYSIRDGYCTFYHAVHEPLKEGEMGINF